MKQVAGVSLEKFEAPIRDALEKYSLISYGEVTFDLDAASQLELTPDKPNSARSATPARHLGEVVGTFYTIMFKPGDGTGDENTYRLQSVDTDIYPAQAKVVPRSKKGVHTEAHLTIASLNLDDADADPVLFAGNQTVLGLRGGNMLSKIGELGQPAYSFQRVMSSGFAAHTTTTLTTGYRGAVWQGIEADRFGDPHAVYNPHPEFIQVCGFIALAPEATEHIGLFHGLAAVEPATV